MQQKLYGDFVVCLFIYGRVCAIFGVQMPTLIIDKVITFHINTVKFDGVMKGKVWCVFFFFYPQCTAKVNCVSSDHGQFDYKK